MTKEITQVESLLAAKLISPSSIDINGSNYSLLDKVTDKVLNRELGMISKSFSNQLYQKSERIWKEFRDEVYDSTKEYRESHKAVIKDGVVIAVSSKSDFEDFYSGISKLAESCNGQVKTYYNGFDLLEAYIQSTDILGIHIEYFLDADYIRATSYLKDTDKRLIYINPVPVVSTVVESSLEKILDYSVLSQYLDTTNIVEYSYKEFVNSLNKTMLSVGELIYHLKHDLGIKYIPELSAYDIAAEDDRYDQESTNRLDLILDQINTQPKVAQYAQPLKKEVTFVSEAVEYYRLLSRLVFLGHLEFYKLADFIQDVLSNKLNYSQLNS